jgi:hypothetical protein
VKLTPEKAALHKNRSKKELIMHYEKLNPEGVKGILVILDDADGLTAEALGELGHIFNNEMEGYVLYIATGSNVFPDVVYGDEKDDIPKIVDPLSGALGYWERVEVLAFTEQELSALLDKYISKTPHIKVLPADRKLLISLCGGNGRLFMLLTQYASRYGTEFKNGISYIHVTQEVVNHTYSAADRLSGKLRATLAALRAQDPDALKPQWW